MTSIIQRAELQAKIWKIANEVRSKIEANEYKDYILSFILIDAMTEIYIYEARQYDALI